MHKSPDTEVSYMYMLICVALQLCTLYVSNGALLHDINSLGPIKFYCVHIALCHDVININIHGVNIIG